MPASISIKSNKSLLAFVLLKNVRRTTQMNNSADRIYHAAIYVRLSKEDGDVASAAKAESNSISNQKNLIRDFLKDKDDIIVVSERVDDGYSGSSFERPAFQMMMGDIKRGTVDCVIVKDLSRFGREYIDSGKYIERLFPALGVRFIAVNDHIDSKEENGRDDIVVPFKNLMNNAYCRDISIKIRSHLEVKRKNGEYTGAFTPYGYKKDENDRNRLVPDPYAAGVVKDIFRMKLHGMSQTAIADRLNRQGILSPMEYKHSLGIRIQDNFRTHGQAEWSSMSVRRILENPYYAGDSRHNEHGRDGFAQKKQWREPEENWIIVEGTHEPVVPRELYLKAQERLKGIHENSPKYGKKNQGELACRNFYKKKIVCGDCGATMYLTKNSNAGADFICGGHQTKKGCDRKRISENAVNDEVLRVIRAHMNVYVDSMVMLKRMNRKTDSMKKYDVLTKEIQKLHHEMEKLAAHRQHLYEDYAERLIDAGQYEAFADRDSAAETKLRKKINEIAEYQKKYDRNYCASHDWQAAIEKYRNIRHLTKKMVDAFVEKIEIFSAGKVTVHLVYDDMLEELVAYTKEREAEDDGR